MSRKDDIGHYEVGNVYICKHSDNARESSKRGNKAQFKKGHKMPQEVIEKIRATLTGVKRPTTICPHCGKKGAIASLKRYHFDNCINIHEQGLIDVKFNR